MFYNIHYITYKIYNKYITKMWPQLDKSYGILRL